MATVARDWRNSNRLCAIKRLIPLWLYLGGLIIVGLYAFLTEYTTVSDTANEYAIYLSYINTSWAETHRFFTSIGYTLQLSCLMTTYVPVLIHRVIPIDPLLLYKIYTVLLSATLPVAIYFVSKRVIKNGQAVLCGVLIFCQTAFIQAPSFLRTILAIVLFCALFIVAIDVQSKWKFVLISVLAGLICITHYGTMYVSAVLFACVGIYYLISKGQRLKIISVSMAVGVLLLFGTWWNPYAFNLVKGTSGGLIYSGNMQNYLTQQTDQQPINSRDKLVQAALGAFHPDGDTKFKFSIPLFLLSWFIVIMSGIGWLWCWWKRLLRAEYIVLGGAFIVMMASVVVIPYVSRIYGIERLWLHGLMVLAPALVIGWDGILPFKWKYVPLVALLLAFGILNAKFGLIYSIMG